MIRIIVVTADANAAAHVGGPVHVEYRTFDIAAPELDAFMAERATWPKPTLTERSIVGVELISDKSDA